MSRQTDQACIARILQGEASAFAQLVHSHKSMATTIAFKVVKNREDAEEVAMDAFVKVYQMLPEFKGEAAFSTWLYRIVYTTALMRIRKKQLPAGSIDSAEAAEVAETDTLSQLEQLNREEQKKYVELGLKQLADEDNLLLTLYYLAESTLEEISEITGIDKGLLKVKLFRARKKLHSVLQHMLKHELKEII